jgi:outer membrane protein assembly factor BamB
MTYNCHRNIMKSKLLVILSLPALMVTLTAANWLSYGGDPQRTGWSPKETDITADNAKSLSLLWKQHLDNQSRELNGLTAPVAAEWVVSDQGMKEIVVVGGASDNLYAMEAATGKLMWKKTFANENKPKQEPFWLCPNALNATPLIRKEGLTADVLTIATDGSLHILNINDGEDRMPPIPFVPPYAKSWSLNMIGGTVYTTTSQGCGGAKSGVWSLDLDHPEHKVAFTMSSGGVWGRAGVAINQEGTNVYALAGDGQIYDPATNHFPDTVLQLSATDLSVTDYFTPANHNYLTRKDLDMGSFSPTVFPLNGKEVVAAGGKEGVVYLLDANHVGGTDHKTYLGRSPVMVNEEADFAGKGFWGSFATAEDDQKRRWLYAPALGAPSSKTKFTLTNGDVTHGSIMAFRVNEAAGVYEVSPAWISRDLNLPEPPIVAGGLVFALSNGEFARQVKGDGALYSSADRIAKHVGNTVLYAFDMKTGKELFSSGDTMPSFTHFSGIAISGGRLYVTTFDSTVYAFGLKN